MADEIRLVTGEEFFRKMCPGCGGPIPLKDVQGIWRCTYCGCDVKIERHLRRIEPDIPDIPPPVAGDPSKEYSNWNTDALMYELMKETDRDKRLAIAEALNEWCRADETLAAWVPAIVEMMLNSKDHEEFERALAEPLIKLICEGDLKLKQAVIRAGEKYGFTLNGSKWFMFALSCGDAGTVKLLLDIAEWAARENDFDYAQEALYGVQTAIGRAGSDIPLCMQILIHRFLYCSPKVQEWMADFIRIQFSVGYTFHFIPMVELIDDCALEKPEVLPLLEKALCSSGGADSAEGYLERVTLLPKLKTREAMLFCLRNMGGPPYGKERQVLDTAMEVLAPLIFDADMREATADRLRTFIWAEGGAPEPIKKLFEDYGKTLPRVFVDSYLLHIGDRRTYDDL